MRQSKFTETQIVAILKEADAGVASVSGGLGFPESIFIHKFNELRSSWITSRGNASRPAGIVNPGAEAE